MNSIDMHTLARPNTQYSAITPDELTKAWEDLSGSPAEPLDAFLGVINPRESTPTAFVSVDLCEVLRYTGREYRRAIGLKPVNTSQYIGSLATHGLDIVTPTVQRLMNDGKIDVIEEISKVATILRKLRAGGAMVVANTSTLPGCELATIDERFMATHLPGCFDGIAFPRNHDGAGKITKASVAKTIMEHVGLDPETSLLVHIDDAPHHILGFRNLFSQSKKLGLFMPRHEGNQDNEATLQYIVNTPLEGFSATKKHIDNHIGEKTA